MLLLLPFLAPSIVVVVASSISRRDTVIGTLTVPLTFTSQGRYAVQVHMGSPVQTFNFSVSTSLGYSVVAANGCGSCSSSAIYNPAISTSEMNLTGSQSVSLGGSLASGSLIKENCQLQQLNGSTWNYPNQTIIAVSSTNSSSAILAADSSGIFGLGVTGSNLSFTDTIFGGFFQRNPHTSVFQYGMALNPPTSNNTQGLSQGGAGVLHWLQPDTASYKGNLTFVPVAQTQPSGQPLNQEPMSSSTDWTIPVQGWTLTVGQSAVTNNTGALATVEPYFTDIFLPFVEANTLYGAIQGAVASQVGDSVQWSIPCSTEMTWSVLFQGLVFPVPSSTLVVQQGSSCVGAIRGWSDPSQTGYLFGSSFISAVYLVFQVGSNQTNSVGIAPRVVVQIVENTGSSKPLGAIIGGTIGGVALLAAIGFGIWFMLQRQHKRQPATADPTLLALREKTVDPFISPPTTAGYNGNFGAQALHHGDTKRNNVNDFAQYVSVPTAVTYHSSSSSGPITPPPLSAQSAISITDRSSPPHVYGYDHQNGGHTQPPTQPPTTLGQSFLSMASPTTAAESSVPSPVTPGGSRSGHDSGTLPNYRIEPLILPDGSSTPPPSKPRGQVLQAQTQQPPRSMMQTDGLSEAGPPPVYSSEQVPGVRQEKR